MLSVTQRWVQQSHLPSSPATCMTLSSRMQGEMMWSSADTRGSGLTNSNYTELGSLHKKYGDKGLEILAFPCNQFGGQELGTNEQIAEFACTRFKAEYPIFGKIDVNGSNASPLYKFLKSEKGGLFGERIKWNFTKFLADKDGHVVGRYAPTSSPLSIENDIQKLLEA
ncbi:hypothetical protein U9M48_034341 [Paspalum notatum var. saurae]|uniref:Glutathione peroxidase n=1 Tax=Paspalum notatum var. saurae TaxID=547442 RepID=A0AAQ3U9T7_PASNO